jgi:predicted lipoprotein
MTAYHVLRLAMAEAKIGDASQPESWEIVARDVPASSASHAIRQHCEQQLTGRTVDAGGMYAAVPARSWKVTPVKAETKTILRLTG